MFAHSQEIEYRTPSTVERSCKLLADNNAEIISGGQSLTQFYKLGLMEPPEMLVDIEQLKLDDITRNSDTLTVGAGVTHRTLQETDEVTENLPILAEGAEKVDDPLVQNMGTIGGNIAHAHPTYHFPPIVVALDGNIQVQGVNGGRTIQAEEFFVDRHETMLDSDEIILGIEFPISEQGDVQTGYIKDEIARGNEFTAQCAVRLLDSDGTCNDARIVLGSVEETPTRVREAETELEGEKLTEEAFETVATTAKEEVDPVNGEVYSATYRRQLVKPMVERALAAAESS